MTRLEWALGGLLLLLLVTIAALMLFLRGEEAPPAQPPAVARTTGARTARDAYELALLPAQVWAEDAQLLQARSDWPRGSFEPERGTWTFHFYSPQRSEVAVIAVGNDGSSLISRQPLQGDLQPADASRWQVDSDAVVQRALEEGGQEFIEQHDEVEMVLILKAQEEVRWTAVLVDGTAQTAFRMELDAASGTVTGLSRPYDD